MTKSMRGSEDGIRVNLYEEGQEYDMERSLAQSFMKSKAAKPAPKKEDKPNDPPGGGAPPAVGGDTTKQGKGPDENK